MKNGSRLDYRRYAIWWCLAFHLLSKSFTRYILCPVYVGRKKLLYHSAITCERFLVFNITRTCFLGLLAWLSDNRGFAGNNKITNSAIVFQANTYRRNKIESIDVVMPLFYRCVSTGFVRHESLNKLT